uniref:Uncharacterized protein n=1 Tax=Anguilla anguilla TaxID=7936 RepID=A0A0E9VJL8_ANGAN
MQKLLLINVLQGDLWLTVTGRKTRKVNALPFNTLLHPHSKRPFRTIPHFTSFKMEDTGGGGRKSPSLFKNVSGV